MKNPFLSLKRCNYPLSDNESTVHKKVNINHIVSFSNTEIRLINGDTLKNSTFKFDLDSLSDAIDKYYNHEYTTTN
jgi:hypothetical protein